MQIRQPASQPDVGWTKHVISLDVFLTFSRMPRTECYFSEPFSIFVGVHKLPRKFRKCDRGDHFLQKHRFRLTFFRLFWDSHERNASFRKKFHILTGQSRRVGAETWEKARRATRGSQRAGGDALEQARWGSDACVGTRCGRRVGAADALAADALAETRCGSDALA